MVTDHPTAAAPGSRTIAVVPVRSLEGAKSRLGEVLDPEERRDLVVELLGRTIGAVREAEGVDAVIVVSRDEAALDIARASGVIALRQTRGGLNAALDEARATALDLGATTLLVVPGDIPAISAAAVGDLLHSLPPAGDSRAAGGARAASGARGLVVLVSDRHGRGTNVLLIRPPDLIPFAFGGDSRVAHRELAIGVGAQYVEREGPLSLDLDTPDDLIAAGFDWIGQPAPR